MKQSKWSEWDLNSRPLDYKSRALTTGPRRLPINSDFLVLGPTRQQPFLIPLLFCIPGCGAKSGVCQIGDHTFNAGKANSRLYFDDGVLYLNLSGGDECHHVAKKRETIISFVCSSDYGNEDVGKPVFISEDDCTYYIVWHTSLVCERQVSSQATLSYIALAISRWQR